jgi:flagellar biosynthesis protein FlhF
MSARLALARAIAAARGAAEAAASESREAIQQAESAVSHGTPSVLPAVLSRMAARLRAQGLTEALTRVVVSRVQAELADEPGAREQEIRVSVLDALASLLPVSPAVDTAPARAEGRPRVIAVVGPTGVGKTTTVAKIAADCRVRLGLRVGIVAADAYRVGAVDQLHAYAQILGAPMRAADSPSAVRSAMLDLAWCDVVLVDTAGRSHRDSPRIAEIGAVLQAARPDDTHLVLSGASAARTLSEAAVAFHHARPTRIVLSKLDECESLGALVQAVRDSGCPVSWFTTGQDVPDDIERADAAAFARRIMDATPTDDQSEGGRS